MASADYIKELEGALSKFLQPIGGLPFHLVIKSLYKVEVLPIDKNSEQDTKLLDDLSKIAAVAGKQAKKNGIFRRRANEVGNDMEPYVKNACHGLKLKAETPKTNLGKKKSTGYPDIYVEDSSGRPVYLEVKTYNLANVDTTQRSFYMSPAKGGVKITKSAPHIVLAFEIEEISRRGERCYVPVAWKIVSIRDMKVSVKHEFNASNRDMYKPEAILRSGKI